jgi:hypothetical protein
MRPFAIFSLLVLVAVAVGQATPEAAPVTAQGQPSWNAPLEKLVPPTEDLKEVLPKLREMRQELKRAVELEKVLAYLESASSAEEQLTADAVYEKLGLFRFPTVDEVSLAIDKAKGPEDILDQELFSAFDRDASIIEVLSDPRLVQRFLESKQVKNGTARLNRRLARRLKHSHLRDAMTLDNVAQSLGLDERATTLDLMEAALEVVNQERGVSLQFHIGDVPVRINLPAKHKRAGEAGPPPDAEVIEPEPIDLDALGTPPESND